MKNRLSSLILSTLFIISLPVMAQEDCEDAFESIQQLHMQKKWNAAKIECESYLRNCGSRARVETILKECESHLQEGKGTKPKSDKSNEENKRFSVSQQMVEFPADGGRKNVRVTSNTSWILYQKPNWVDTYQSGNTLTIFCAANNYASDREEDIVLLNSKNQKLTITIVQDRNGDYLKLSSNLINDSQGNGGRYTINVTSNKAWSVRNKPQWCTVSTEANRIVVTLERNKTGYTRRGDIEIVSTYASSIKQTIAVQQSSLQHYIYISPQVVNSPNGKKGEATVTVDTDYGNYRVTNLPYWCKLLRQNSTSFVLEIDDNSGGQARTAECKVVAGDKVEILTIKQGSRMSYVNVSPKIVNAVTDGGIITINVKSSGSWRVVNLPDWCQVTDQTNTSFTLTIARNPGASRTATFSVSSSGIRENVMVIQE